MHPPAPANPPPIPPRQRRVYELSAPLNFSGAVQEASRASRGIAVRSQRQEVSRHQNHAVRLTWLPYGFSGSLFPCDSRSKTWLPTPSSIETMCQGPLEGLECPAREYSYLYTICLPIPFSKNISEDPPVPGPAPGTKTAG